MVRREMEQDPEAMAAAQRIKNGGTDMADIAKVIPYIPEFRKQMLDSEHARAEGRTVRLDELMKRLDELDEEDGKE